MPTGCSFVVLIRSQQAQFDLLFQSLSSHDGTMKRDRFARTRTGAGDYKVIRLYVEMH